MTVKASKWYNQIDKYVVLDFSQVFHTLYVRVSTTILSCWPHSLKYTVWFDQLASQVIYGGWEKDIVLGRMRCPDSQAYNALELLATW